MGPSKALHAITQTTETKCKSINCKKKLKSLELNENTGQNTTYTNVECFEDNCQDSSSQADQFPAESLLNQGLQSRASTENVETIKQLTESEDEFAKSKEKQKGIIADAEEQNSSGSYKSHELTKPHEDTFSSKVDVYVKYAREKHRVEIGLPCSGLQALKCFSRALHVPLERLKVIHKGKLQTESTVLETLKPNSLFLAFGEMAESEDGLEPEDIELIMKQLSVERNVAIKALRKTNCLIDAIFEIGNNI